MESESKTKASQTQIVPGFEILGLLGRGGMGAVYRARKLNIGKEVALKVLLPSLAEDPVTAARFDREVRALALLRHEGLVNVIDAGEAPPYRYMVLDLVEGSDLQRMVEEDGPLDPALVESIARQVLEALSYVHELGMVHRDLKPANLILDPAQHVRLCDLGLVRIVDESSQLTQALMLGTPEYVSPEQVRGESDLDIRSDLYSLGATLYFLLAGHPPFEAETPMATAQLQVSARALPIEKCRPAVPPRLARLIQDLMQKRPGKRPADPSAALALLDSPVPRSRRLSRAATVIAPAVLGFSLFGGLRLFGNGETPSPDPGRAAPAPVVHEAELTPEERVLLQADYDVLRQELSTLEAQGAELTGSLRVAFEEGMQKIRARIADTGRKLAVKR